MIIGNIIGGSPGKGSGVYIGPGDMPEDYYVQIDPEGDATYLIEAPATAEVGQMLTVTEVDENGKPIKWEAVDQPKCIEVETASVGQMLAVTEVDKNGKPIKWDAVDKPLGINIGTAAVGQAVVVKSVDANGIPTEYKGIDIVDGNTALFYADGNEVAY